jgi:DNA-binding response OmpR family regulator
VGGGDAGRIATMPRDQAATVLVVEDDASIRDLLHEVLEGEGYRVLRAVDGVQGFHLATADRPDVILLDIGITPASGADLLGRLRGNDSTTRIPVIALAGQPPPAGDVPHRPDGWIEKPFDLDTLLEHVGRLAARQGSAVAAFTAADGMI